MEKNSTTKNKNAQKKQKERISQNLRNSHLLNWKMNKSSRCFFNNVAFKNSFCIPPLPVVIILNIDFFLIFLDLILLCAIVLVSYHLHCFYLIHGAGNYHCTLVPSSL